MYSFFSRHVLSNSLNLRLPSALKTTTPPAHSNNTSGRLLFGNNTTASCAFRPTAMAGITYAKHTQTVYLKADQAPPFPQNVRHWIISSVELTVLPDVDPKENEAYLATLPDRIVTVPMLHHSYRSLVVTILLLVWTYAFCCRFPRACTTMARLGPWYYGLPGLAMLPFAYLDRLGLYMTLLSATTALCGRTVGRSGTSRCADLGTARMDNHSHRLDSNLRRLGHRLSQRHPPSRLRNLPRTATTSQVHTQSTRRDRRARLSRVLVIRRPSTAAAMSQRPHSLQRLPLAAPRSGQIPLPVLPQVTLHLQIAGSQEYHPPINRHWHRRDARFPLDRPRAAAAQRILLRGGQVCLQDLVLRAVCLVLAVRIAEGMTTGKH